ncbi:MAG TPA: DMT family transporter [Alphaproteobacteria bacterium]|nr:DMT family transporter [Alphaproteobacteria bacterium]
MQSATAARFDATTHRRGIALVALAAIFWSTGGLIVRSLDAADVWTTVFWRSLSAAGFLISYIGWRERGRSVQVFRAMGLPGVVVGVCIGTSSICLVLSFHLTTVANTLIIFSTSPLIAAALAYVVLGEKVDVRSWLVMAVALGGVAVMVSASIAPGSLLGNLLAFFIALGSAIATVTIRKYRDVRMTPATCLGCALAALVALPLGEPLSVTRGDFGLLFVFGAFQLGSGFVLFVAGAQRAPAAQVALIALLEPILGPIWVWAFLGERPGPMSLLGGGIVLAALAAHTAIDLRRAKAIPPAI